MAYVKVSRASRSTHPSLPRYESGIFDKGEGRVGMVPLLEQYLRIDLLVWIKVIHSACREIT